MHKHLKRVLRVLVVDDSAYVRKTIRQILSRSPLLEVVGTATDGEEALEKVEELQPDVVTLDLVMPGLDGLGFLERQMVVRPLPVIVVSTASGQHDSVLKALEAGAADFVQKPSALANERLLEMGEELIGKLMMAADIRPKRLDRLTPAKALASSGTARGIGSVDAVVIGISTGGPQALKYLIPQIPEDFLLPIAVALHIPAGFTEMYAARLDELSNLEVVEAREGEPLRPGVVLIAPGGRHLTFSRNTDGTVIARVNAPPSEVLHVPSVDVLFASAAEIFRDRVLGVVMTGMGCDGRQGAARIKARGGRIYTESEETCVVYGMPAAVVEAGLSDRAIPLDRLADAILEVA